MPRTLAFFAGLVAVGARPGRLPRLLVLPCFAVAMLALGTGPAAAADYPSAVLADHPVSYWRLNETSGTVAADQTGRTPGAIYGSVALGQSGPVAGGGSFGFDGSDGVDLGRPAPASLVPAASWALEAWVKASSADASDCVHTYAQLCDAYRLHDYGFELFMNTSGSIAGLADTPTQPPTFYPVMSTTRLADSQWHYIVLVRDMSSLTLYVDGAANASTPVHEQGITTDRYGVTIGNDTVCNCTGWRGSLAEVAFYNYALTAAQVAAHYQAAGVLPPLISTHYRIELKSWIPQKRVVDPEAPIDHLPYVDSPQEPVCTFPHNILLKGAYLLGTSVVSRFGGDDHTDYGDANQGGYRVLLPLEFDWDGTRITNFHVANETLLGTTHRYIDQLSVDGRHSCVEQLPDTGEVGKKNTGSSGNSFSAEFRVSNPLEFAAKIAPDYATISGTLQADGSIDLHLHHTIFPSDGVRVLMDGQTVYRNVFSDASCLSQDDVLGLGGAARLAAGLTETTDTFIHDGPQSNPVPAPTPSKICDAGYVLTDPLPDGGHATAAQLARAAGRQAGGERVAVAAGGERVAVAPLTVRGASMSPGRFLSLADAVGQRLVGVAPDGHGQQMLVARRDRPVALRFTGANIAFRQRLVGGRGNGQLRYYLSKHVRVLVTVTNTAVAVTTRGRSLHPVRADTRPPITRVQAKWRRGRVTLSFRVRDRAGVVATYVVVDARRIRVTRGHVTLRLRHRTVVGFYSIDAFGNAERVRRLVIR